MNKVMIVLMSFMMMMSVVGSVNAGPRNKACRTNTTQVSGRGGLFGGHKAQKQHNNNTKKINRKNGLGGRR